jgi:galactokinase
LPEGVAVVVADTSVRRTLADSAYNNRRAACEEAVRILKRDLPDISALRDVSPSDFARYSAKLPPKVQKRARHVVEEIERTRQAVKFLETGDMAGFGDLMNECHASLRDLYEVSCEELDAMVRVAQSLDGCYGARLTGAGFGGCTVNLVDRQTARDFSLALAAGYESATGRQAGIYLCRASAGAGLI